MERPAEQESGRLPSGVPDGAGGGTARPRWRDLLAGACRRLAVWATGLLAALVAVLALAQIVCLALCLLALVLLAVCFLMASYPGECRQFWSMLREMRAGARDTDA